MTIGEPPGAWPVQGVLLWDVDNMPGPRGGMLALAETLSGILAA